MKHATYTAASRPGRIVCPHCELGRMKYIDSSAAHCKRCGCTLNGHVLGDLRRITSLPETLSHHACEECGHPELRLLPEGVFHCPACGSEVLPAKGLCPWIPSECDEPVAR